jgi:RNA polymerase sigma-70 factor (ECF subfamily)
VLLRPLLSGHDPGEYESLARDLEMTPGALRVALHRLRRTFRDELRQLIQETVANPVDVDDELRYLLAALSR